MTRRPATLIFIASLALFTLTAGGSLTSTDAVVTFDLTRSLVERGSIALSGDLLGSARNQGRDGRYYSQFGIGHSLYNIPFYLAGKIAANAAGRQIGKPDTIPKAAVALGSAMAAAAAVTLLFLLATAMSESAQAGFIAAASAAIASPLWPYSRFGFSTALTTAILAGIAYWLWMCVARGSRRDALSAGLIAAFGWLTRHEMALMLAPLAMFVLLESRRRGISRRTAVALTATFLGTAAIGGVLWMLYNYVRFGHPTFVGYTPRFGTVGYAAFIVSPAGSILLFAPIALVWGASLLGIARRHAAVALLLAGPLIVSYLFYGSLTDWPGGRSYGPRYLVPGLVLLAPALAVALTRRAIGARAAWIAIAVAAILQLPGVLVDYSKVSLEWARGATREQVLERNWHIGSSPLVLNTSAAIRAVPQNIRYLTGMAPLPEVARAAAADDRDFAQRFAFSLDFWWLYLVYLRALPRLAGIAIAAALAAIAWAAASAAWKWVSRESVWRSSATAG